MKNKKMAVSAASAVIQLFSGLAFALFDSGFELAGGRR